MSKPLFALVTAGLAAVAAVAGLAGVAGAKPWWAARGVESNDGDYLDPNVAFRVTAGVEDRVIEVRWVIADGYYLYRQKIEIQAESPDLALSAPRLPPGSIKVDPYFGTQEIYKQQVQASVPYSRTDAGAHPLAIKVTYQGCADAGLCYPPISKVLMPRRPMPSADGSASSANALAYRWERVAILGGVLAFLLAGLLLRKGRTLDLPAA